MKIKSQKKPNKKRLIVFLGVLIVLAALSLYFEIPVTRHFELSGEGKIKEQVRIAHVSDLHSCYYGPNMKSLVKRIGKEEPDLVLLTGDIFDDKLKDKNAKLFVEAMVEKYPVYYVTGNHEYWSEHVDETKVYLTSVGVVVLEGGYAKEEINGNTVYVCGVDDPTRLLRSTWELQLANADPWYSGEEAEVGYKILLSHRPEEVETYEKYDFDLILCGHAHGGQWRIPFTRLGYFAPNQGMMAKYVDGLFDLKNGSQMIVSRGLARESTPAPRFFNHPEVIIVDIK